MRWTARRARLRRWMDLGLSGGGWTSGGARLRVVLEDLVRDVRHAARSLRRSPGFTALAALTLAAGIGAGTAMFSVLNGVLLRELPVRDQGEVVVLWPESRGAADRLPVFQGELTDFRRTTRSLESVAGMAYQGSAEQVLRDGETPLTALGTWVTGDFFPLLDVAPLIGRTLVPSDDVPGAAPVMVIGEGLWRRHFGADPAALGRVLEWNGTPFTVVGIVPRGFELPAGAELWIPVHAAFPAEAVKRVSGYVLYDVVGRLRPGVGAEAARAEFEAYLRRSEAEGDPGSRGARAVVAPLVDWLTGGARATLWIATAAVGLLLLIACINVANLLLIRSSARGQELAVRTALGASGGRLVRQVLTESGVLALLGGALGVPLAYAAVRLLVYLAPPGLPRRETIAVDARVLVFAVGITAAAALLAGLLPALRAAASDPGGRLRGEGRTASAHGSGQRLRHGLVVAQIALAILVVVSAGLLVRSHSRLQGVEMGFNDERLLVLQTSLPPDLVPERTRQLALLDELLERVEAIPGVVGAASLPARPFSETGGWNAWYTAEGQTADAQAANPLLNLESVGPEYFRTLELPVLRGRAFGAQDREGAPPVAIVSDAVARRTWPGEDPIGRRLKLGSPDAPGEWLTVVGVVGETRYRDLVEPQPSLYLPTRQFGPMPTGLAVRVQRDPDGASAQVRRALREVHPDWMLVGGGTMRELRAAPLARPRFSAGLMAAFAALTLILAAVGIYGAIAATVRQRTREIGIRLALGADAADVRRRVLLQGLRLAAVGATVGVAGALLATRLLRGLLFGVSPTDPPTFVLVIGVIVGAALLACDLPARRAARVDPAIALRAEG